MRDGVLSLPDLIATMSCNPAKLLGLASGTLTVGAAADLCIFDPEKQWQLDRDQLQSKSHNAPWHGNIMTGQVTQTVMGGKIVYNKNL